YIFTESAEVASAVADLSTLLACSILLNSIQPVLSGVEYALTTLLYRQVSAAKLRVKKWSVGSDQQAEGDEQNARN
ncbi:hypothetical protein AG4045_013658, partial [Apium graveolens]